MDFEVHAPFAGRLVLNRPGSAAMRVLALGGPEILGEAYTTLVAAEGAYHHFQHHGAGGLSKSLERWGSDRELVSK